MNARWASRGGGRNSTGVSRPGDQQATETAKGASPPLVCGYAAGFTAGAFAWWPSGGVSRKIAASIATAAGSSIRSGSLAVLGNAARRRRRPAVRPRGPWRSSRQRAAGPPRRVAASGLTLLLVADRDCPRPRPQRVCRPTRAGARATIKTVDERAVTDRHRASGGTDVACRVADPCRVPRRSAIPPAARLARTRAWSAPRARRGRVPQPAVDPVAARTR